MNAVRTVARGTTGAERQLKGFVAKFEPRHQTLILAVRRALRKRFPTANEEDQWIATLGSSSTGEQRLIAFLADSGAYYDAS